MVKRTLPLIAFVLLAYTALLPAQHQHKLASPEGQKASDGKQDNPPTNIAIHDLKGRPDTNQAENDSKSHGNGRVYQVQIVNVDKAWHFWLPFVINTIVALVGAITAIAVWLQVKALIVAQRAWVILTPDVFNSKKETYGAAPSLQPMSFDIKNVGPTPANIISVSLRYILLENLGELPDKPIYAEPKSRVGLLLVPTDSANELVALEYGTLSQAALISKLIDGTRIPYAYGYVRYKDSFNRKRETRVGYVFEYLNLPLSAGRRPKRAGPPAYNAAT
jgi:hypothetical protein